MTRSEPLILFHNYTSSDIDLIFPHYMRGEIGGFPPGMSQGELILALNIWKMKMQIYMASYNGEVVAMFEARPSEKDTGYTEIHIVWFTHSRKKRLLVGLKFLSQTTGDIIAYVPTNESKGHFALARKGYLRYLGERNEMQIFDNREDKWALNQPS